MYLKMKSREVCFLFDVMVVVVVESIHSRTRLLLVDFLTKTKTNIERILSTFQLAQPTTTLDSWVLFLSLCYFIREKKNTRMHTPLVIDKIYTT